MAKPSEETTQRLALTVLHHNGYVPLSAISAAVEGPRGLRALGLATVTIPQGRGIDWAFVGLTGPGREAAERTAAQEAGRSTRPLTDPERELMRWLAGGGNDHGAALGEPAEGPLEALVELGLIYADSPHVPLRPASIFFTPRGSALLEGERAPAGASGTLPARPQPKGD